MLPKGETEFKTTRSFGTDVADFKKSIQEIKSNVIEKLSSLPPPAQAIVKQRQLKQTPPTEDWTKSEFVENPSRKNGTREREEHELDNLKNVLVHQEVKTSYTDIVRLRKSDDRKPALYF